MLVDVQASDDFVEITDLPWVILNKLRESKDVDVEEEFLAHLCVTWWSSAAERFEIQRIAQRVRLEFLGSLRPTEQHQDHEFRPDGFLSGAPTSSAGDPSCGSAAAGISGAERPEVFESRFSVANEEFS